jgi:hypothetical protein
VCASPGSAYCRAMALLPEQLKRLAYGASHSIIQQSLDNGELPALDLQEFLPQGYDMQDSDYEELQAAIEGVVLSDLWEEQAKLDA